MFLDNGEKTETGLQNLREREMFVEETEMFVGCTSELRRKSGPIRRTFGAGYRISSNESEDKGAMEFKACIPVLVDKVGFLSRHRADLLERVSRAEVAHELLKKKLKEKNELVKTVHAKHQLENQAI